MHAYGADETRARLPFPELARAIARMLARRKAGRISAPERMALPAGAGQLLVMPASDDDLAMVKLLTVHPGNRAQGLPSILGEVLVMEAATGRRLGVLDGQIVTARRTAALSLLAAQHLAPLGCDTDGPMLLVGAGVQARAHMEAFVEGLGVRRVFIYSRTGSHAELLADFGRSLGVHAQAVDRPEDVLPEMSLVVSATTSTSPVFQDCLSERAFVAAVGSHTPHMAELPPALVRRARLYADTLEGVSREAGCLIQAGVDMSSVTALEDALQQERPETGPVVFKSVGHSLFDLAAARLALLGGEETI